MSEYLQRVDDHWKHVYRAHGSDDKLVKEIILNEHAGMSVVAALVATINAALLLMKPDDFLPTNSFNKGAQFIAVAALSLSFGGCIYIVGVAMLIYANTLKVPACKIMDWVHCIKGKHNLGTEVFFIWGSTFI